MSRPPNVTVYFENEDQYVAFVDQAKKEGFKSKSAYGLKILAEACNLPPFFAPSVPDQEQRVDIGTFRKEVSA